MTIAGIPFIYARYGFGEIKEVKEGVMREYAFFRDKFQDLIMYSLLKTDIQI